MLLHRDWRLEGRCFCKTSVYHFVKGYNDRVRAEKSSPILTWRGGCKNRTFDGKEEREDRHKNHRFVSGWQTQ